MPISDGRHPTAEEVLRLFRRGKSTLQIANMLNIREAEAYRLLHVARDLERSKNDQDNFAASTIGEQALAHNKNGGDVSLSQIQNVEKVCGLADSQPSETPTDKG